MIKPPVFVVKFTYTLSDPDGTTYGPLSTWLAGSSYKDCVDQFHKANAGLTIISTEQTAPNPESTTDDGIEQYEQERSRVNAERDALPPAAPELSGPTPSVEVQGEEVRGANEDMPPIAV